MKDLVMMIVETWAHCFGVAPANLCMTPLSVAHFLSKNKICDCTLEVGVIPKIKNVDPPSIGLTDCQKAVADKPNQYFLNNLLKQIICFIKKNTFCEYCFYRKVNTNYLEKLYLKKFLYFFLILHGRNAY